MNSAEGFYLVDRALHTHTNSALVSFPLFWLISGYGETVGETGLDELTILWKTSISEE